MPTSTLQRPFTSDERETLQRINAARPTRTGRIVQALISFVILSAGCMGAVMVVWLVVTLIAKAVADLRVGWHSPAAVWILGTTVPIIAVYSAVYNWRWFKRAPDPRAAISKDLRGGAVVEERYHFTAAKCFQEPEHGGLLYFLLDDSTRPYVVFDHESQDLGVRGESPQSSTLVPRSELLVVRAPNTRIVLRQEFSGHPLDAGAPVELTIRPEKWPEPDEYCSLKWSELERRLSGRTHDRQELR